VETIIYLEYVQNCFLRCRSTYVAKWEVTEASGKGIKKKKGYRAEGEKESCVEEDREILEERDRN